MILRDFLFWATSGRYHIGYHICIIHTSHFMYDIWYMIHCIHDAFMYVYIYIYIHIERERERDLTLWVLIKSWRFGFVVIPVPFHGFPSGIIRKNWNDAEKISMAPAQGWHAQIEKCNTCAFPRNAVGLWRAWYDLYDEFIRLAETRLAQIVKLP